MLLRATENASGATDRPHDTGGRAKVVGFHSASRPPRTGTVWRPESFRCNLAVPSGVKLGQWPCARAGPDATDCDPGDLLVLILILLVPVRGDEELLQGFTRDSSARERQWEEKFRALPSPDNQRDYMQRLTARPHHVGSPYDKDNAEWILSKFKEWGWDAHIETFEVLFPTPKERLVEMIEPTRFTAKLEEPPVPLDPTSNQKSEQLPSYNVYSIDGDVTAPLVFVNYGLPSDYEELDRLGVSVKGAIVIAKYGNSWRGIKPKVAAEHGAIGCLIYSDPGDDGYVVDKVFPEGPMRPAEGVQRGSVIDFPSSSPGDPLTPGVGATADAKRLAIKDAANLTKIPVLPISYGDAQPLLAALAGRWLRKEWRGALPFPTTSAGSGEGTSESGFQLGHEDGLRRDRTHSRLDRTRRHGSSAAITTTRG